ncbi:DNA damage-repair/toleration protein DRT102 [Eucalyptus grandis]|uniref:Cupin type-2 domain-containing protein n=1 Tax=Eucalyptus grandis TaxID=71139 RepID=A0A058ZRD6_EUCGR|nr:DNA damage-repair/toleration protein DRT102 [Eucalyptus grandis]KAK2631969.1 hypothetical protein EUGRSUZ_L02186 [Eucalyptus grandis]
MAGFPVAAAAIARPNKIIVGATPSGAPLKDALVPRIREEPGIEVQDLGIGFTIAADVGRRVSSSRGSGARGLVVCGSDHIGSILANKFSGIFATACRSVDDAVDARSISNSNVLVISPNSTPWDFAYDIFRAWLKTPFKSPCPASGGWPWGDGVQESLDRAQFEMAQIGVRISEPDVCVSWPFCCLANSPVTSPFEKIPGGSVKIIRENPTSATVKFNAGSLEPPHHHTSGHERLLLQGEMSVWNLSKKKRYDLGAGNYLFTPGGDVHMVKYHKDTKLFVNWFGPCNMFFDRELDTAEMAIDE